MNDPPFERAFVAVLSLLGEPIDLREKRFASLGCQALVHGLANADRSDRSARATLVAPEVLRICIGLERAALR